jgi:hypothetical protein
VAALDAEVDAGWRIDQTRRPGRLRRGLNGIAPSSLSQTGRLERY